MSAAGVSWLLYVHEDHQVMSTFPSITVVTPSYNQAEFLEATIRSVLDQGYPNLQYLVIDGGSTDGSVDIIKKYESQISYWISEPDQGQVDAINKGLRMATGEWVTWQNSDDTFCPGAFYGLADAVVRHPKADLIIGNMTLIDQAGQSLRDIHYVTPTYGAMLAEGMILTNQSAFWRRSVHADIGYLDETLDCSFDFEWFLRLLKNHKAAYVNQMWGCYRLHEATKTSNLADRFAVERARILRDIKFPAWKKPIYRIRRMALTLLQGEFSYVARGVVRLVSGKSGELY